MSNVNRAIIRKSLQELADKNFQQRVWFASSGPEISSFEEAVCHLFDDSGLDVALKAGGAFGKDIDDQLSALAAIAQKIPANTPPLKIINDPNMQEIRKMASYILKLIS